jgi:hypothetical protein
MRGIASGVSTGSRGSPRCATAGDGWGGRWSIVWDRLRAPPAKPVPQGLAGHRADYQIAWLPSYAPDLNPAELCNGAAQGALLNAPPGSVAELRRDARRSFRRLGRRTTELHSVFRPGGLPC